MPDYSVNGVVFIPQPDKTCEIKTFNVPIIKADSEIQAFRLWAKLAHSHFNVDLWCRSETISKLETDQEKEIVKT